MRKLFVLLLFALLTLPVVAQSDDDDMEMTLPEPQTFEMEEFGLEINYYETEGEGFDIFLIHGNSSSGRAFLKQLALLGDEYHVVAMDLPGHGLSDHASEETAPEVYNMPGYAQVVVALAEELEMTEGLFVGSSLGGHIVLEAIDELPDAAGFVIYGTPPVGIPMAADAFLPSPGMAYVFAPELTEEDIEIWVPETFAPGYEGIPDAAYEDMAATDGNARAFLGVSVVDGNYQDEVEVIANMEAPLVILHGEGETLVNLEYINTLEMPTLWREEVQIVPVAGHYIHWEEPEAFNDLLIEFINDVTEME